MGASVLFFFFPAAPRVLKRNAPTRNDCIPRCDPFKSQTQLEGNTKRKRKRKKEKRKEKRIEKSGTAVRRGAKSMQMSMQMSLGRSLVSLSDASFPGSDPAGSADRR